MATSSAEVDENRDDLSKQKLVLGCGNRLDMGAINQDVWRHRPEIDVVWDLNDLPWPWPDNRFLAVSAWAVLEHVKSLMLSESIDEVWRITKPGGILDIKLPYWRSAVSYDDLSHCWHIGLHAFDQLDPSTRRGKTYDFYTLRKWKILRCGLNRGGTSVCARLQSLKGSSE